MTGIIIIKIFLASSSELKDDREQFEIFINRKNKEYIKQSVFLELVIWEDFLDAMSATRLQDEYNKAITDCDVFVSLFKTKVGRYTEEEFTQAFKTFQNNKRPLIYTYFQDSQINVNQVNLEDLMSLKNFKDKLSQLGHYYIIYKNIDDLKHRFSEQLNKFLPKLADNLRLIPISNRSQSDEIAKLKQELKDIKAVSSQKKEELKQQLEQERSHKQQLEGSHQSQIEEKESEITRLQNTAKSQQEKNEELTKKLEDKERSHKQQIEEIKVVSSQERKELEQNYQSQKQELEQKVESFTKQQANLQAAQEKIAEKEAIIAKQRQQIEQLKSSPKDTPKDEVELKSEKGVDYTKLRDLLATRKWKEADEETSQVVLKVANREDQGWLELEDIDNFPSEDLRTLNQLWLHYSKGKFGFSVQKEIYESLGGTRVYDEEVWNDWLDRVGWRKGEEIVNYSKLTFNLDEAPEGHLPRNGGSLLSRKDL